MLAVVTGARQGPIQTTVGAAKLRFSVRVLAVVKRVGPGAIETVVGAGKLQVRRFSRVCGQEALFTEVPRSQRSEEVGGFLWSWSHWWLDKKSFPDICSSSVCARLSPQQEVPQLLQLRRCY